MINNYIGFFSWQHNSWDAQGWFKYLFLSLWVIALISIFLTKDLIKKRFDRGGKFLFFKSDIVMWRTIGAIVNKDK